MAYDWSRYSLVKIGGLPLPVKMNQVNADYNAHMQMAMRQLNHQGYERIGLVINTYTLAVSEGTILGSFLYHQEIGRNAAIRPLIHHGPFDRFSTKSLKQWIRREKLDAIVCCDGKLVQMIYDCGYNIPDDLGIVHLLHGDDVQGIAGVDPQRRDWGEAAIEMLGSQLNRNVYGEHLQPETTLITGHWVDGKSIRQLNKEPVNPVVSGREYYSRGNTQSL